MSNTYGYPSEQMDAIGTKLVSIRNEIDGKFGEAQSAVSGLIDSGFTTAVASGAYSEQFSPCPTTSERWPRTWSLLACSCRGTARPSSTWTAKWAPRCAADPRGC